MRAAASSRIAGTARSRCFPYMKTLLRRALACLPLALTVCGCATSDREAERGRYAVVVVDGVTYSEGSPRGDLYTAG